MKLDKERKASTAVVVSRKVFPNCKDGLGRRRRDRWVRVLCLCFTDDGVGIESLVWCREPCMISFFAIYGCRLGTVFRSFTVQCYLCS